MRTTPRRADGGRKLLPAGRSEEEGLEGGVRRRSRAVRRVGGLRQGSGRSKEGSGAAAGGGVSRASWSKQGGGVIRASWSWQGVGVGGVSKALGVRKAGGAAGRSKDSTEEGGRKEEGRRKGGITLAC